MLRELSGMSRLLGFDTGGNTGRVGIASVLLPEKAWSIALYFGGTTPAHGWFLLPYIRVMGIPCSTTSP